MASSVDTYRLVQDMKGADVPESQGVAMLYAAIEAADGRQEAMDRRAEDIKKDLTLTVYKATAVATALILAAIGIATGILLAAPA